MLLGVKSLDYLDYSPSSNVLTITRNPFGFSNKIKVDSGYQGVTNVKKLDNGESAIDNEYLSDDDVPDYRTQANNYSSDDEEKTVPITGGVGFHQHLKSQLSSLILTDEEERIAEFVALAFDENSNSPTFK